MCGSSQAPAYVQPYQSGYGVDNLQGGSDLLNQILQKTKNGLDQNVRGTMINQGMGAVTGAYNKGTSDINSAYAGSGLSQGGRIGALLGLNKNLGEGANQVYNNINLADQQAKAEGFNQWLQTVGLGANVGNMKNNYLLNSANAQNNYNMNKYQIDEQNSFKLGDVLGGLFGTAGTVLGGMASGGTGFFRK